MRKRTQLYQKKIQQAHINSSADSQSITRRGNSKQDKGKKFPTTKCQVCLQKASQYLTTYASPELMFVGFVDQEHHPHFHPTIKDTLILSIQNENVHYCLQSITYYDGGHFIQRARLNNGNIIRYDGMGPNQGIAQLENPSDLINQFPSTFKIHQTKWYAHTAWYLRTEIIMNERYDTSDNTPSDEYIKVVNPMELINLADQSSQESTPQDRNTFKNNKKK